MYISVISNLRHFLPASGKHRNLILFWNRILKKVRINLLLHRKGLEFLQRLCLLWFPDGKYYLKGREIGPEWLEPDGIGGKGEGR